MVAVMPTVAKRVTAFLAKHSSTAFCDDCLRTRLSLARQREARETMGALVATGQLARGVLRCVDCGVTKKALQAV
jgi:hypothetical protein